MFKYLMKKQEMLETRVVCLALGRRWFPSEWLASRNKEVFNQRLCRFFPAATKHITAGSDGRTEKG